MKKSTQRILAIVLVAVIGIGIGTGAYFFLVEEAAEYKWEDTPGAPAGVSQNRIIKFGLLDDMGYITGEGLYRGAWMAAYEINQRGGVPINNETYYVGLATEDTEESNPALDISRGVAAAERMLYYKKAQFLLGGFRTEATQAYRDVAMGKGGAEKIFFGTGSATGSFCEDVINDYEKYKYWFRINPLNEVFLAGEILHMLFYTIYNEFTIGTNITRLAIIREGLLWTGAMSSTIKGYIGMLSAALHNGDPSAISFVYERAFPMTDTLSQFYGYWDEIQDLDTQITIPLISGPHGILYSTVYGETNQPSLSLGINVMGQQSGFWGQTAGNCEYEIEMTSFIRHNKTPWTIAWWDHYIGNFTDAPIYTATGGYVGIQILVTAIWDAQSLDTETLILELEKAEFQGGTGTAMEPKYGMGSPTATYSFWTDASYPHPSITTRHDMLEGPSPMPNAVFVQWRDGTFECVECGGIPGFPYPFSVALYPAYLATDTLTWPIR